MPTTFERTRIASAILTAVAMLSTPTFAADEAPDTTLSLKLPCLKTEELQYDVAGKFVGDLKVGYMSTYKDLNLGMSYSLSAGDAGRQNHAVELTMRVDF